MKHAGARLTALASVMFAFAVVSFAQSSKVDLTGKWLFTVETSAGPGTPSITLKQDGEKLTGHYSGQLGESDLTGSVKDQTVVFTFAVETQGYTLNCSYTGTIESKDALKGKMSIAGLAEGTFTAKRQ
jgi:hypothetical protein